MAYFSSLFEDKKEMRRERSMESEDLLSRISEVRIKELGTVRF
ncbi:hypothetical protein EfmAA242_21300 [Enterococcus faecium]|nr:hypothetical protein EfmAA242_21300 [Enterococcus faecium]